jgi:hypothetical protein
VKAVRKQKRLSGHAGTNTEQTYEWDLDENMDAGELQPESTRHAKAQRLPPGPVVPLSKQNKSAFEQKASPKKTEPSQHESHVHINLGKSPGSVREEAAVNKTIVSMQGQLLQAAEIREKSQEAHFLMMMDHQGRASKAYLESIDRSMVRQDQFYARQSASEAFGRFENPSAIQGNMFSQILAHSSGLPPSDFDAERDSRLLPVAQIPTAHSLMAIENGM